MDKYIFSATTFNMFNFHYATKTFIQTSGNMDVYINVFETNNKQKKMKSDTVKTYT